LYYPTTTSTTGSLVQGQQYTINTTHTGTGYFSAAWIDYNADGNFDATEFINLTTTASAGTATFTVPLSAVPGLTGMRVRTYFSAMTATQGCAASASYETEDYIITMIQTTACNGTPTVGTASAPPSVCSGAPFTLNLTNNTVGTGITMQWQISPASAGTWTNIPGATSASYIVAAGQTVAKDYRAYIACANGGASDTSVILPVAMSPFYNCYCSSGATSPADEEIFNVTIGSLNNSSTCATVGPGPGSVNSSYSNYSLQPPTTITQGSVVPVSISIGYCATGVYSNVAAIYIDYNQNGVYTDPGENVYTSTYGTSGNVAIPRVVTGNFTVSLTSTVGTTGMRVVAVESTVVSPCGTYSWGETEDYAVTIAAASGCIQPSGLAANNITSTSADLSWTAVTGAVGYEYVLDQVSAAPSTAGTATMSTVYNATGLTPATVYYIHVRTDCGSSTFSPWSTLSFSTSIPNDVCSGAYTVWTTMTGNNTFATDDILPSVTCGLTPGSNFKGLWYKVTPASSGSLTLSLCSGSTVWDSYMRIYEGTCGSFTTCTGFDDDGCSAGGLSTYTITSAVANTTYYILITGWDAAGFGPFTLTATGVPLAVKLLDISAQNSGSRNRIDWTTGEEAPGDHFILERSVDGTNYSALTTIDAKGQPAAYSYWDEEPITGVNYYRPKLMNAAGNFTYSKVVTATVKQGVFTVEAYPNPVSKILTVKLYGTLASNPSITISDITGKVVDVVPVTGSKVMLNMGGFANGLYLIKYSDNERSQSIKVNKQ
jgi:hypothetical protein